MTDSQFEKAVETYGDTIFRVAYSYLKNRSDAEDVMQETLLKLYQEDGRFESEEHRKRWLIRVAVNQCRDELKRSRRTELPLEAAGPLALTPEERGVLEQVAALPEKLRTVIHLHYYEGYSVREIAEVLGVTVSAVKMRMKRGRDALRERLEEAV